MTHPVRVPRDALTIPAYSDVDAWARLGGQDLQIIREVLRDRNYVWPWLASNGFRFHIPREAPIHLTRDGRTVYAERLLIRTPSPWNRPYSGRRTRDRYILTPDRQAFSTRLVGYPITRPLEHYAPTLAARIGVTR